MRCASASTCRRGPSRGHRAGACQSVRDGRRASGLHGHPRADRRRARHHVGHAQGGGHRRNGPRLLPPGRRPRVAARALSPAHPRRARDGQAAGDPHAVRRGGYHRASCARRAPPKPAASCIASPRPGTSRSARSTSGFHLSFSGIVTFKNALAIKDVARRVPLDRMLIETDSPYLAPAPHRGKRNQPAWVPLVAAEIARLRGGPGRDHRRRHHRQFLSTSSRSMPMSRLLRTDHLRTTSFCLHPCCCRIRRPTAHAHQR